jgi:hypothetical protein
MRSPSFQAARSEEIRRSSFGDPVRLLPDHERTPIKMHDVNLMRIPFPEIGKTTIPEKRMRQTQVC